MSTRPTRAVLVPLAAAGVLHLLVRVTGGGWLSLGAAAALALPLVALLLRPRLDGLTVTMTAGRSMAGGTALLDLRVTAGVRATPPCRLTVAPGLLAGAVVAVPALAPRASTGARLELAAPDRGTAQGLDLVLTSTAPFGLVRGHRALRAPVHVVVRPAPATTTAPPGVGVGTAGSSAQAGAGTEVLGLRPWRVGDATAAVHARSTARHGRPVVLEREREHGPRLVLLVGALGHGPAWEASVSRAAALCLHALRTGGEPVLVGPAPAPRPSVDGVLDWLAGLEAAGPGGPAEAARAGREVGRDGGVLLLGGPGLPGGSGLPGGRQ